MRRSGSQRVGRRPGGAVWRGESGRGGGTMNRVEHGGEAIVEYLDANLRLVRPGSYVVCAVTGARIPLDQLKYWSVDRQEAYAGPEAALQRLAAKPGSRAR